VLNTTSGEYCARAWSCSSHTHPTDPVNNALRTVIGCLRPAPEDNLLMLTGIQPAELRRKGVTMSLGGRAMEPERLLHSAPISTPCGFELHFKSRHTILPAVQKLICSSDDNNRNTTLWVVVDGMVGEDYKTPYFHSPHRHPPSWNRPAKNSVGPS